MFEDLTLYTGVDQQRSPQGAKAEKNTYLIHVTAWLFMEKMSRPRFFHQHKLYRLVRPCQRS